jgi:hypothetical protein
VRTDPGTVRIPDPGAHGGDGAAVAAALGLGPDGLLDLSLSVNPVAPDWIAVMKRHLVRSGAIRTRPGPAWRWQAPSGWTRPGCW